MQRYKDQIGDRYTQREKGIVFNFNFLSQNELHKAHALVLRPQAQVGHTLLLFY